MEASFGSVAGRLFDLEGLGTGAGQFSKLFFVYSFFSHPVFREHIPK